MATRNLSIAIGDTAESLRLKKNLRDFAAVSGFEGRYGGDISAVIRSIASMPKPFRDAIALAIKTINQASINQVDNLE